MKRVSFLKTDTREPEKTPLIDIIFLLLIFFFVSITSQSSVSKSNEKSENVTRQKLMRLSNANIISDSSFVLVEVKSVTIQIAVQMDHIRNTLQQFFTQCTQPVPAVLNNAVSPGEFCIFIKRLDELTQEVDNLTGAGCSPATIRKANKLAGEFPRILTNASVDLNINNYIHLFPDNVFTRWIYDNDVKLHLRFERTVPLKALLVFYQLSEDLNLSFKKLEVRVINKKAD